MDAQPTSSNRIYAALRRYSRTGIIIIGTAALVGGITLFWLGDAQRVAAFFTPANDVRDQLEQWCAQLAEIHSEEQTQAEAHLVDQLLDHAQSQQLSKGVTPQHYSPAQWFREEGARRVVASLLLRFESGVREREAADFLRGLAAAYPDEIKRYGTADCDVRAELRAGGFPLPMARHLCDRDDPLNGYALFVLEESDSAPGYWCSSLLVQRFLSTESEHIRSRILRLLDRVPDRVLTQLLQRQFASDFPYEALTPLWRHRCPQQSGCPTFEKWLENADRYRAQYIGVALDSLQEEEVEAALNRFQWDPVPALDAKILERARHSPVPPAVLMALTAIPVSAAVQRVTAGVSHPGERPVALAVLSRWSGEEIGQYEGEWDLGQSPLEALHRLDQWRTVGAELGASEPVAAVVSGFGTGQPSARESRLLPLLALRSDLDADWYQENGRAIVAQLNHDDPEIRCGVLRALGYWESHRATRVLTRQYLATEDDGDRAIGRRAQHVAQDAVRACLLDRLLDLAGPQHLELVLREVAHSGTYRGAEILEAFLTAFPQIQTLSVLKKLSGDTDPTIRAGAAYLMAGLPASSDSAGPLLKLLLDPDERTRFWADRSLRNLYDTDAGFEAAMTPNLRNQAVARWYDIVQRNAGNR